MCSLGDLFGGVYCVCVLLGWVMLDIDCDGVGEWCVVVVE